MPTLEKLRVRDYHPNDLFEIQRIHEKMGLDYNLPDLGQHIILIKKVVEFEGEIIAAGAVRLEAELLLWVNHEVGLPSDRWEAVQAINGAVMDEAHWLQGLDHCVCWVPQTVEKSFGKRLKLLGFTRDRDGWHSWSRPTRIHESTH